jgi:hypothetical protein
VTRVSGKFLQCRKLRWYCAREERLGHRKFGTKGLDGAPLIERSQRRLTEARAETRVGLTLNVEQYAQKFIHGIPSTVHTDGSKPSLMKPR